MLQFRILTVKKPLISKIQIETYFSPCHIRRQCPVTVFFVVMIQVEIESIFRRHFAGRFQSARFQLGVRQSPEQHALFQDLIGRFDLSLVMVLFRLSIGYGNAVSVVRLVLRLFRILFLLYLQKRIKSLKIKNPIFKFNIKLSKLNTRLFKRFKLRIKLKNQLFKLKAHIWVPKTHQF